VFDPREKIAIFIDGLSLHIAQKQLNLNLDYSKLLDFFRKESFVLRAIYYTSFMETADDQTNTMRPLLDWLDYHGYQIVLKKSKEYTDRAGRTKIKGSTEIDLTVDCMEYSKHVDHLVLFTGNGDYKPLIEALQRSGKKVTVVSSLDDQNKTGFPVISDDLRRTADHFIDLNDIRDLIEKDYNDSNDD
jgi:uncharacterized LabA/DUF88 family protein